MSDLPEFDERDDVAVILRVVGGDTNAFEVLVNKYQGRVWCLLRNLVPSHVLVEDVAQDVFVSAFVNLASFDAHRGRFSSWLLTIAKNHALNARKRRVPLVVAELPVSAAHCTPRDELECSRTIQRLDVALEELPEEQRLTFVLAEFLDLSTEQIAELEAVSPSTVRSRLSRAKAALMAALDAAESEP